MEKASERLKLHYQPTLHAIQLLSVIISKHSNAIREELHNHTKAKCLAITLLSLSYRLYFGANNIHMREWVRLIREDSDASCNGI